MIHIGKYMSKTIAKVYSSWDIYDSDLTSLSSTYLPDHYRIGYFTTGMPMGYYLKFVNLED